MQGTFYVQNEGEVGIAYGLGVCSCDGDAMRCTCFPAEDNPREDEDDFDIVAETDKGTVCVLSILSNTSFLYME